MSKTKDALEKEPRTMTDENRQFIWGAVAMLVSIAALFMIISPFMPHNRPARQPEVRCGNYKIDGGKIHRATAGTAYLCGLRYGPEDSNTAKAVTCRRCLVKEKSKKGVDGR